MASLIETNPYLKDPEKVREMLERNAYQSSIMSGATGLKKPESLRNKEKQKQPRVTLPEGKESATDKPQ